MQLVLAVEIKWQISSGNKCCVTRTICFAKSRRLRQFKLTIKCPTRKKIIHWVSSKINSRSNIFSCSLFSTKIRDVIKITLNNINALYKKKTLYTNNESIISESYPNMPRVSEIKRTRKAKNGKILSAKSISISRDSPYKSGMRGKTYVITERTIKTLRNRWRILHIREN